jgi:hypothetical protein
MHISSAATANFLILKQHSIELGEEKFRSRVERQFQTLFLSGAKNFNLHHIPSCVAEICNRKDFHLNSFAKDLGNQEDKVRTFEDVFMKLRVFQAFVIDSKRKFIKNLNCNPWQMITIIGGSHQFLLHFYLSSFYFSTFVSFFLHL